MTALEVLRGEGVQSGCDSSESSTWHLPYRKRGRSIGGLIVLAGARLGKRETSITCDILKEVSLNGLDVGSPVKYSGIRIGRVDRISIDPEDVSVIVVELSLDEGIVQSSKANLGSMGITGLKCRS